MKWQMKIFTLIIGLFLLLLGFALPLISSWLYWFGIFFLSMVGLLLVGFIILSWQISREKLLDVRATRKQKEYRTELDGHGMLHLINVITGHTQNLTIDTRAYRNGHYEVPSTHELAAFSAVVSKGKELPLQASTSLLSASESELDLLSIFTQPTQSYAIIAGQQVGKTFQAQRIAQYWLDTGLKPIVIGPKWDKGEWVNCALFGGEYNFERVAQGMRIVQKMAQERHEDKNKSHKEQPIQPVFFDDWTAIRAKLPNEAEAFILDATTLYASVNIILYFIIHLDTANAWGVGKVGAALHQNFIKLRIEPGFNEAGLVDRSRNIGWLVMPGMSSRKDWKRVKLFGGLGQPLLLPDLIIQPNDNRESKIISLIQSGATDKEIAQEIFNKSYLSGDNFYKVKELREKYI